MAGARITVQFDDAAVLRAFGALSKLGHAPGLMRAIGAALVATTDRRFQSQSDPWGRPWAGLSPAYLPIKRGTQILTASGALVRSITSQVEGATVIVGTNRIYGGVHQFGAVIKAKTSKGLRFKLAYYGPKGGVSRAWVTMQQVAIPARPYLGFGVADREAVLEQVGIAVRHAVESA